jgi:hypothetical protein
MTAAPDTIRESHEGVVSERWPSGPPVPWPRRERVTTTAAPDTIRESQEGVVSERWPSGPPVPWPRRRPRPRPPDRIDELVERVRPIAQRAVDRFEIAASLESDGITDDVANGTFGCADVFALAEEVERRSGSQPDPPPAPAAVEKPRAALRDIAHGLLYLIPAAVFPAGIALLDRNALVIGVLFVGGVGWVWSGAAAWLAYQFLGRGLAASAARVMRWAALGALPAAAVTCVVVIETTGASPGLLGVGLAQMTFQVSSGLLMFYRREMLFFAAMAPAVVVGIAYLIAGERLLPVTLVVVCCSFVAAFGLGLFQTRTSGRGSEPSLAAGLRRHARQLAVVVLYTALSATYLLQVQSLFMADHFDILVAFLPLIIGMGVVEWRARRFGEDARRLQFGVRYPREFVGRLWLLLAHNVGICLAATGALTLLLFGALQTLWYLDPAAIVLSVAGLFLGVAYLVGFLLANMGLYRWLSASFAVSTAVNVLPVATGLVSRTPMVETILFLGSALLLLALFTAALAGRLREVRTFR